ncbi:MAG: transposase, partial [Lachnospiraceae bacterium]|nr:transposase [Lachnospiraceae bacterium]
RPVITVVLYFGTEHRWKQPRNLLSLVNVPEGLQGFVNDYVITVFEVAWLSDEQVKRFHSDFKVVANFFTRKRQNKDYIPDDPTEIKHVDEVLKLLSAMTGDRRYEGLLSAGEEIGNMCDVAERLERKGIEIGANNTIFKLVSKGRLTPEEGAEELNMEMTEFMNALEEWKLTAKAH